ERMVDLSRDIRLKALIAFKNHGGPAGATLFHGHSQLIAVPFVPETLEAEVRAARRHFDEKERCVFCDIVAQESRDKERVELKPVLTQQAGFEWASGCYINPTPPEEAASFLRQTEVFS